MVGIRFVGSLDLSSASKFRFLGTIKLAFYFYLLAANDGFESLSWLNLAYFLGFQFGFEEYPLGTELGGYCDHSADDIVDRLPVDPFGMGIRSTFTAITGWLQGFEKEHESYGSGCMKHLMVDYWQPEVCDLRFDGISIPYDSFDEYGINDGGFVLDGNVEEFLSFSGNLDFCDGAKELQVETKEIQGCSIMHPNSEGSAPHDAIFYALSFLGVKDLLSVEKVCRSFRDSVRSDPLLWRSIVIDWPLNEIVTDDVLIKLTDRAQGTLQALTLVHCVHITDFGLQRVFDRNPKLTKLSVPGCLKISVEDILLNLYTLKSAGKPGIKQLRIGGLSGITEMQFEELKFLLGADNCVQFRAPKPRFFHGGLSHLSCDDDCAIDVEVCPRCQKLSLVYDCPAKSCQGKHHADQMCRLARSA
ncbi:Ribonuclease inhibitor [Prunus dulcis]|uniref:Ribonuclease inhibitor n=1 Tax=Prunus dulcis TaxID=3755 RepID=A0A4Y1R9H1_PRUDU|nr:Ribonuclease inhibitor [Prunus dulcis]